MFLSFRSMGKNAGIAVFYSAFCISKISSAFFSKSIKGTKAIKAIEIFFVIGFMAREEFAFFVAEKFFAVHFLRLLQLQSLRVEQ